MGEMALGEMGIHRELVVVTQMIYSAIPEGMFLAKPLNLNLPPKCLTSTGKMANVRQHFSLHRDACVPKAQVAIKGEALLNIVLHFSSTVEVKEIG
jgi:hypothetical protein